MWAQELGTGCGADDVEAALRIIRCKTAGATVERPVRLGAGAAGEGAMITAVAS
uniref:Uncharacterized protein n=1 Tax=Streptomyces sp. NBC_00093 TaxID=2975649 RepID=A0AAU2AEV2_9ACTN